MNISKKVTILVCSCDKYQDLWKPFFYFLNKNWENCELKILLNTESKRYSYSNLNIFTCHNENTKHESYGERMIKCLQSIDTPYTILLLDDFFIRNTVNVDHISQVVQWMDENKDIAYFSFGANPRNCIDDQKYDGYVKMQDIEIYKLNMQAAMWRTEKLLKYWNKEDDPWTWELIANCTAFNTSDIFYTIKNPDDSPIKYGYKDEGMGVYRGKWVIEDVKPLFESNNILVDYSIRGIYDKKTDKSTYKPSFDILKYSLKRVGVKYTFLICHFYIQKVISLKLKGKYKYKDFASYLTKRKSI